MKEQLHFATEQEYLDYINHLPVAAEGVQLKNFSRVQIVEEDGRIVGDSGFTGPNAVVNLGFNQFLVMSLGSIAGSKYLTHFALGTGSQPGAADTSLQGEVGTRTAVTAASTTGSKTLRCTATFAAGWHSSASAHNISNIGVFNTSSGGTIFAGNTYASSSCASNQAVRLNWRRLAAMLVGKLREFGEQLLALLSAESIPSQQLAFASGRV